MSTADHTTCCCTETLNELRVLQAAYRSAYRAYEDAGRRDRDEMAGRLTEAIAERDRARDTAARLWDESADMAVPGPGRGLGAPGSPGSDGDWDSLTPGPERPSVRSDGKDGDQ